MLFKNYMLISFILILCLTQTICKKKKLNKDMILRQKETNGVNFVRIAVMRLIYGIAVRLGFGEQISEALNGAFVPPGVDDYTDYGGGDGFSLFRGDDDDYDYR